MIRHRNRARRGASFGGIAAAGLLTLGACANQSPQSVCGSPETLSAVRGLLLDTMARGLNVDGSAFEEAFAEMATIELITFEGRDDQTKIIRCRAQVRTTGTTSQFSIDFSRQPTVDTGFVYSIEFDGTDAWNALGMGLVPRAQAIARMRRSSSEDIASHETTESLSLDEAPPSSTPMPQHQDADGVWPGGSGPPIAREQNPAPHEQLAPPTPLSASSEPTSSATAARSGVTGSVAPAATASPPPFTIARKADRVEHTGPRVIVPGPPPPPAAPLPRRLSLVSDPSWSRPPLTEFPERARERGIQRGTVALNCAVQPNGSLSDCAVTSEAPTGAGFAQAALAASMGARVSPRVVDRLSAGGRTIFAVQMRDNADTQ